MKNLQPTKSLEQTRDPYDGFDEEDLILRDYLAADRTGLANERTFLAYVRTALALFAAGVTLVHFFDSVWLEIIGWAFVPCGVATLLIGAIRCKRVRDRIYQVQKAPRKA